MVLSQKNRKGKEKGEDGKKKEEVELENKEKKGGGQRILKRSAERLLFLLPRTQLPPSHPPHKS